MPRIKAKAVQARTVAALWHYEISASFVVPALAWWMAAWHAILAAFGFTWTWPLATHMLKIIWVESYLTLLPWQLKHITFMYTCSLGLK